MENRDRSDDPKAAPSWPFQASEEFPPPSSTVHVTFGARSRPGRGHAVNADHYAIVEMGRHLEMLFTSLPEGALPARFDEYGYGMAVADGFGVGAEGEEASRLALGTLVQLILRFGKWNLRVDADIAREIIDRARSFYRRIDGTVLQRGLGTDPGLETTLTAAFGAGRDLFFAHVGHSRAYLSRAGALMCLTHDHTLLGGQSRRSPGAQLVDVGAATRDVRHIMTDTIGMGTRGGPSIDIYQIRVDDDDRVLLCTNGLTDVVEEETIGKILSSERSPEEQSRLLIEAAPGNAPDDATVLVARYRMPE